MKRITFEFHPCNYEEWGKITAEDEKDMPEDGAWLWWLDRKGQIEKARLKIDAEDHFHPLPKYLDEWNVIGWLGMSDVETHDDCINRQEVYKIIGKLHVGDVRFFEKLRRGLEALPSVRPDVKTFYDIGFTDGVKAYAAMVEIEKEEKEAEWIPCSERLPEDGDTYLVTIEYNGEVIGVDAASYSPVEGYIDKHWDTFNDWKEDDDTCYHVTAWMPLPEEYKKEDNK